MNSSTARSGEPSRSASKPMVTRASASTQGSPAARAAAAASSARRPAAVSSPIYISVCAWVDSARACSRLGGSAGSARTAVEAAASASAGSSISSR